MNRAVVRMLTAGTLLLWTGVGLGAYAAWRSVGKRFLSSEARERRRRRRNYARSASSRHGPTVKLAAKIKDS